MVNEIKKVNLDTAKTKILIQEKDFRASLKNLDNIYRSVKFSNKEKIDTTVSFMIIKYISDKEEEMWTFNVSRKEGVIKLWKDFNGNYKDCFENGTKNFLSGDYCDDYKDFNKLVSFSKKLKNEDYKGIYKELDKYNLHGADFDLFGIIYETFADSKEKKSFGEFYTRRHITKTIAKILLYREEDYKKDLKICDCCCGTGGFLTEAFKVLRNNWNRENNLTSDNKKHLEKDIFFGFDDREESIARTELNMFLVGDGHTNINKRDTLKNFDGKDGLEKDTYDYIISNPPYGNYKGSEKIENFWSKEKRYEMLFVEKIIKATKRGGRMAIVIPDGILESPSREYFRKKMLSNIDIEIIISLPKFAFAPYTKEKTYVIFARRKQKESEGQFQKNPIWNYIIDYDGYANSDKRYETKLQGKDGNYLNFDLPELEESFKDKKEIKKEIKGEVVHKSKLVEISEINESNFHNLLSEFHLRPRKINKTDQDNFDKHLIEIKDSIKEIQVEESINKIEEKVEYFEKPLGEIFDIVSGKDISDEEIYNNGGKIPIISGQTSNNGIKGFCSKEFLEKKNKEKIIDNQCITITKDGVYSGKMFFRENKFFLGGHCNLIKLKEGFTGKINLKWFYYTQQQILYRNVISQEGNGSLPKEVLERIKIKYPKETKNQEIIIEKYEELEKMMRLTESIFYKQKCLFEKMMV